MQVLIIPDLHGRTVWKHAVKDPKFSSAERIVFMGDYVDSRDLADQQIYKNLVDIIKFRETNPEKVVLILGNHDIQYLYYPHYRCSGFRSSMQRDLSTLFQDKSSLFQVAFQLKNHLWTHAGVSNGWLNKNRLILENEGLEDNHYAELFNKISLSSHRDILHQVGVIRGGSYQNGGITWADLKETYSNPLNGMNQYVGHTPVKEPFKHDVSQWRASITYVDCLQATYKFITVSV